MSVQPGETIKFKVKYDGGALPLRHPPPGLLRRRRGARLSKSGIQPATPTQMQPACLPDDDTGLIDCGNWAVSAQWTVPSDAVSGVYIAHLVNDDTGGDSQILFVVRDDSSHSNVLVSTSDATWEAYNAYGGNSLYGVHGRLPARQPRRVQGRVRGLLQPPVRRLARRPTAASRTCSYTEYQMIRFLERNGYDVSYTSQVDVDRSASPLKQPQGLPVHRPRRVLVGATCAPTSRPRATPASTSRSSAATRCSGRRATRQQRRHQHRRPHGDLLQGDALRRAARTRSPLDRHVARPALQPARRRRPPAERADRPALHGQLAAPRTSQVPAAYSKLRFWRNTQVAGLTGSQSLTLAPGTGIARLRVGRRRRQRLPARGLVPPVLDHGRRARDVHRLRHDGHRRRRPMTHNMTLYRRRAARWSSARARCSGRGAWTTPTRGAAARPARRQRRRTATCSRRRSTSSPTWARSRPR